MSELDSTYSTIVSMLPVTITETKPGLTPNEYIIPASENGFSLTIIPNNVFYMLNPDPLSDAKETRHVRVPVPSIELARSIIYDYVSSLLAVSLPDTVPGLFAVVGDYREKPIVKVKFAKELEFYQATQNRWFRNLVDIADDTWSKTHSPMGISEIQRIAANSLELKREWLNPPNPEDQSKCPFCKNVINFGAIKCLSCGEILDKKKYVELTGEKVK